MSALTVRLDDETLGALDRLAERIDRPRDTLIAEAVQTYLALNDWQLARIEEGLAAADRGEFATAEEVERVRRKFASG